MYNKLVNDAVLKIQDSLITNNVSEKYLKYVSQILQPQHYESVVTERNASNQCGLPTCKNQLPDFQQERRGRFKIDLKNQKIYDLRDSSNVQYCSEKCHLESLRYKSTLSEDSIHARKCEYV